MGIFSIRFQQNSSGAMVWARETFTARQKPGILLDNSFNWSPPFGSFAQQKITSDLPNMFFPLYDIAFRPNISECCRPSSVSRHTQNCLLPDDTSFIMQCCVDTPLRRGEGGSKIRPWVRAPSLMKHRLTTRLNELTEATGVTNPFQDLISPDEHPPNSCTSLVSPFCRRNFTHNLEKPLLHLFITWAAHSNPDLPYRNRSLFLFSERARHIPRKIQLEQKGSMF